MVETLSPESLTQGVSPTKGRKLTKHSLSVSVRSRPEPLSELQGCVKVLFDVLELYGLSDRAVPRSHSRQVQRAFVQTCEKWRLLAASLVGDPKAWMTVAKYKIAAFFHAHTDQLDAPPPSPFPPSVRDRADTLLCGVGGRYLTRLLRTLDRVDRASLLQTIWQAKKGMPRPTPEIMKASVKETVMKLTTRRPDVPVVDLVPGTDDQICRDRSIRWADMSDVEHIVSPDTIKEQLRRTVRELFRGTTYDRKVETSRPWFASTSAGFRSAVQDGGQFAAISKAVKELGFAESKSRVRYQRVYDAGLSMEREGIEQEQLADRWEAKVEKLDTDFAEMYDAFLRIAMVEGTQVKPVALAEALKVRVITKGPEFTNYCLKPVQRFMWNILKGHPVFELIGKPVTPWLVQKAMGANLATDQMYVSGDYSDATNKLAPWVSETIAREIAAVTNMPLEETVLFVRALTRHRIFGPAAEEGEEGKRGERIGGGDPLGDRQQWGQLMGSVVSFPVLCIANAALCRWAMEHQLLKHCSLKQLPLLINGDDCLFKTGLTGLRVWKVVTSAAGLEPSLGKFFASRDFANINSTMYLRRAVAIQRIDPTGRRSKHGTATPVERPAWFDSVPYVNMGLMFGMKRSAESKATVFEANPTEGLGVRCREMIRDCPILLREAALKKFVRTHRSTLTKTRLPWFVPEGYGGVGLPALFTVDDDLNRVQVVGPTTLDYRVCARLRERPDLYPVATVPRDIPWTVWQLVGTRLPAKPNVYEYSRKDEDNFAALQGRLVVDLLMSEEKLFLRNPIAKGVMVVRRNEHSWNAALHKGNLPPPLSYQTLLESSPPQPLLLIAPLARTA